MRRWKRFKVDVRVRLRRWEEPEESALVVRSYELGEGGISVYASETLEMGTFMMLAFQLPGMEQGMRLRAVVRDRRGFRCGLEFVDLKVAERAEILRYLASLVDVIEL
jgi:c-di-GMP-binding flagellar brake protein YcgR